MKGPNGDRAGPIDWKGIKRKSTPIIDDRGAMYFQQNSRMSIANEIGRRHGMAQSNVPNAGAAVLGLATAWTPNGPVIIQQTISGGLTSLSGTPNPLPLWTDLQLRAPIGTIGSTCNIYSQGQAGTTSTTISFTLPASSCAGTCAVSGVETARSAPFYGYQFVVKADAITVLTTACLVNSGSSIAIPAGTAIVQVIVTGGCSGAGSVGNWTASVSSP